MTPEWFDEAVLSAIHEALSERLSSIEYRLQNFLEVNLGLYKPSPFEKYFSRIILDHTVDDSHLSEFVHIEHQPRKPRKIRFFTK